MRLPALYPILDTEALARRGCPVEDAARGVLEAGAGIVQLRHKGHYTRRAFQGAERVAELCRQAGALFILDDRADIARLVGAGLHVGQDDLPPGDARRIIGPDPVLGFSTHNAEQLAAAAAEPVDYVALGPVFATQSKERPDPVIGVEGLRKLRPLGGRPLAAIGGITRENARSVLEAGADSLAVIADLMPEPCSFETMRARTKEWLELLK